jgi:hypothetical protein
VSKIIGGTAPHEIIGSPGVFIDPSTGKKMMAEGGITSDLLPHIANRPTLIEYAEAGSEAFIPLANDGRRARAIALTRKVGAFYGYDLIARPGVTDSNSTTNLAASAAPWTADCGESEIYLDPVDVRPRSCARHDLHRHAGAH